MRIPFVKAHGDGNDFLLSWEREVRGVELAEAARALCDRHRGVGADGWLLVAEGEVGHCDAAIRLFNSDGSEAEISGNGTRCAAAFLLDAGLNRDAVRIRTAAGVRPLRLLERTGRHFSFEMNMGRPSWREDELRLPLEGIGSVGGVTILDVGNPQCVVMVEQFPENWRDLGAAIERHARFPRRTNVSFVRVLDGHTIQARFWERGAGETVSSGTGSMGAAVASILRGLTRSPVRVVTAGGGLDLRWEGEVWLTGPAEIVARGEFG